MLRFTFSPNGLYKVINLYLTFVSTCRIAVRHTGLPCELTPCDFTSSPRFDGGIERHFSLCLGCTFRFLFQSFCADGSKESLTKICTAFYVVLFRVRSRSACLSFGHGCSLSSYGFCPTVRLPEHCQHFTLGNLVRQVRRYFSRACFVQKWRVVSLHSTVLRKNHIVPATSIDKPTS